MVDFAFGYVGFAHHDLKVPDQGFHIVIYIFFRRQVEFRHIREVFALRHIVQGLADDLQALPHFFLANHKAIIGISADADGYLKFKVFIRTVRICDPDIIVYTCCTQVRTGKAIVQCAFGTDRACLGSAVKEYPVAFEQCTEFSEGFWKLCEECIDPLVYFGAEVALQSADASDVGGQACTADVFEYIIDLFPPLEHVGKPCQCTCIHTDDRIAYDMVGDTGEFHDDDAHVLGAFWDINS